MSRMRVSLLLAIAGSFFAAAASAQSGVSAHDRPAVNPLVKISYLPPDSDYFVGLRDRLKARGVLEELQQFLAPLKLPRRLEIRTKECGETNAFYEPSDVSVNICYEYVDWLERLTPKIDKRLSKASDVLTGAFVEVVLHELGHAVIDLYQVPVFGSEEDAADQIAGFVMLQFGTTTAHRLLTGTAYTYRAQASMVSKPSFSDIHSTDLQRYYNYLCLAYGGQPDTFKDLAGRLPKDRAADCQREYQQVEFAFVQTVGRHIDGALLEVSRKVDWLRPTDGTSP